MRPYHSPVRSFGECASFLGARVEKSEIEIRGICSDSRSVEADDLFVALPGLHHHGIEFLAGARARGCRAIATDDAGAKVARSESADAALVVVKDPRTILGPLSSWFYGIPSSQMKVLGVTGTNGKTTTTYLLHQILSASGQEAGLIGTIENRIGSEVVAATHTTPEADSLQRLLATMNERHCTSVAMEVSSHALALHRVQGTRFHAVAFTNLSQDHLDFHQTMENYFQAKRSLFTTDYADRALMMIDDDYGARLFKEVSIPSLSLSVRNPKANWHYSSVERISGGYALSIRGEGGVLIEGTLRLLGEHNLANALVAVAMATEAGVDPLVIGRTLELLTPVPGRLESVDCGQDFIALVDYAHTPDAVTRILSTVRGFTTGKVIAVLGCGGDRDATKRPLMGKALLDGADHAIFTSDNPRSENPSAILADMTRGLQLHSDSKIIEDRKEAIVAAVRSAAAGDVVIILGKGHESGQEIAGVKHPFSDQKILAEVIAP